MSLPAEVLRQWREAQEDEQSRRAASLLGSCYADHELDGMRLPPLRLRHYAMLESIGFKWSANEWKTIDYCRIWLIWHDAVGPNVGLFRKWRVLRSFRKRPLTATRLLHEALMVEFCDCPPSPSRPDASAPITSMSGCLVDLLCSEYGWSIEYALNLPMRLVWQLVRAIMKRRDPDVPIGNQSDRILSEWLNRN